MKNEIEHKSRKVINKKNISDILQLYKFTISIKSSLLLVVI